MKPSPPPLCLRHPPAERRRSADLSTRLTTEQMQFLGALAEQRGITRADALALMIDVVVGGRTLPVVPRGMIPTPATFRAVQQRAMLIDQELHVLTPRINIPLPPSADPDYDTFASWRTRWMALFPRLIESVSALETLRGQLLPQLRFEPVKLARVADLWTKRIAHIYARTHAQLTSTSDVALHEQLADVAETWQLLFQIGLATPSAELEKTATKGFPLAVNREPFHRTAVVNDPATDRAPGDAGHITFRVRITKRHEQDLKSVRRRLGCRDKSAAVRQVIERYRQVGNPWEVPVRTASLADLISAKHLASRLAQRLREVTSRLGAPLGDAADEAFVIQVRQWKDCCEQLLARTLAVECEIRCIVRAMNGLQNTSLEQYLPFLHRFWFTQLPGWLAGAETRLEELTKRGSGDGHELTELKTMLDSRDLWRLLHALGVAPPVVEKTPQTLR